MKPTELEKIYFENQREIIDESEKNEINKNKNTIKIFLIEDEQPRLNYISTMVKNLKYNNKILIAISTHLFKTKSTHDMISLVLDTIINEKPNVVILDLSWNESDIYNELEQSKNIHETLKNRGNPKVLKLFNSILDNNSYKDTEINLKKLPFIIWTLYSNSISKIFNILYEGRLNYSVIEKDDVENLEKKIRQSLLFGEIISRYTSYIAGPNKENVSLFAQMLNLAGHNGKVFITGDSGTGKRYVAELIHHLSPRQDKPFVRIDCGTIPRDLIESELFGYEPNKFMNDKDGKKGLFEIADKGTIFLDEIAELPLDVQQKLLGVLDNGEIPKIGRVKEIKVDVRVIAASLKNIQTESDAGRFRKDLLYRFGKNIISLMPLKDRKSDIDIFIQAFLYNCLISNSDKKEPILSRFEELKNDINLLYNYQFPGNIRELKDIIDAYLLSEDIPLRDLLIPIKEAQRESNIVTELLRIIPLQDKSFSDFFDHLKYEVIIGAVDLAKSQGKDQKHIAELFKMEPKDLSRIKKSLEHKLKDDNEKD